MKLNKTILVGIIFIFLAGIIFLTDVLNPIIRPLTYYFLMGSSKGKDILFFGLFGLFLILSQSSAILKKDMDSAKYLKMSIIVGSVLLALGIFLEVLFRFQNGIALNTIFASMANKITTTSILHTHILKSILGAILVNLAGPFIQNGINTGVGLYSYIPSVAYVVILIVPVLFVLIVLALQKRSWLTTFFLSFFSSCLIIGIIDGGLFGTPAVVGICGLYLFYRNGLYIERGFGLILNRGDLLDESDKVQPPYRFSKMSQARFLFNRFVPYFVVILIIALRFTVAIAGAETDYYTVEVINPADSIDMGNITIESVQYENTTNQNKTIYHIDSSYNEMELLNELRIPLNSSCDYYTVSWNIYSYL
jgi:hypothetical protein